MQADDILLDVEDRMQKAVAKLKRELTGIRTGRANPGLVDSVKVEVYGSSMPIKSTDVKSRIYYLKTMRNNMSGYWAETALPL